MAPREQTSENDAENGIAPPTSNADLVEGAGKVKLDEAKGWGKGIISDIKNTVGSHWVEVRPQERITVQTNDNGISSLTFANNATCRK